MGMGIFLTTQPKTLVYNFSAYDTGSSAYSEKLVKDRKCCVKGKVVGNLTGFHSLLNFETTLNMAGVRSRNVWQGKVELSDNNTFFRDNQPVLGKIRKSRNSFPPSCIEKHKHIL